MLYHIKKLDPLLVIRIDEKLRRLNSLRPLPPTVIAKLKQQFAIEMTYNSNAIEGNSLTLKETAWVIQDGLTIKGKPLKDHLEAKDHYDALNYLFDVVDRNVQQTISQIFIRSIHKLVVRETEREEAGAYRSVNVMITGSDHRPPEAHEIRSLMENLIRWWRDNEKKLHPIELAASIHHKIVFIHPFGDGNGRTARLIMNLILMHHGYPLAVILKNDRKKYYRALSSADHDNKTPLVRFIAQSVERSLNMYLKVLMPTTKSTEKYLPLSAIANKTNYSQKYLNLLARYGKIEAHKEKRFWMTTKTAIDKYRKNRLRKR